MLIIVWFSLAFILYFIARYWSDIVQLYKLNRRCTENLKCLDGPPHLPLIGSAHLFKLDNLEFTHQLEEWGRAYLFGKDSDGVTKHTQVGMMKVWVGPVPIVFFGTHESIRPLLESVVNISKPNQYDKITEWIGSGLLTSTHEKWFRRRKMLTPTFHFNVIKQYFPIFAAQGELFADLLEKHAGNEFFDAFPYIKRLTLDIICETAMGTQVNAQVGGNNEYFTAVHRISEIIWDHERFPWYWFKPIWYLSGMGFEFDRNVKMTTNFTRKVIAARKAELQQMDSDELTIGGSKKMAFLDLLLTMQAEKGELSDEDIREEVDTFMFEGHDTTASSIAFTLLWLGLTPDCQKKLLEEIDEVFGDSDRSPTEEDIKKLVYLEKCIKEALRLFPSVPIIARRLSEDLVVDHPTEGKVCLPAGLTVAIAPLATSRDERFFDKPDEFNPEHFNPENIAKRDPFTYIPFSAGPRNCIGQKFALLEEKTVLSWFFRRYSLETEKVFEEQRPLPELILRPSNGVRIRLTKRNQF